jgi:hypothetical protein
MAKLRKVLQAQDLENGVLVRSDKTGGIYRLGPPQKKNVNLNVVNHCQLYKRSGELAAEKWLNLSNLRAQGFKLYNQ